MGYTRVTSANFALQMGGTRLIMPTMAELTVQYPDDLLVASGRSREAIEQELKFQLAVRLFEVGQLSLGKAAELAAMSRPQFADELGRINIPVINLDDREIQAELHALREDSDRR